MKQKTLIFALLLIFLLLNSCYFGKTVVYNFAGIKDYKIFKNREIKAGKYQAWEKANDYNKYKISENGLEVLNKYKAVSYLIVQNNKLVHEQYWRGYDENTYSNSFSVAKSFVSLLVGFAIDDGKIKSIDQKVSDFIPEYAEGRNSELTIRNVITMSTGLKWKESYINPFSVTAKAYYGNNLNKLVCKLKVVEDPGKKFKYLSINTQVLAMIVEKAVGKNISEYMSEKLWIPLGAKNDALWCLDKKSGTEKAFCCFNSNAKDFAKVGQFCLNKGKWNGKQLLSESYLNESFAKADYITYAGNPVIFYGYMWWMGDYKGHHITYARGILGQYIFMIPDYNAVVVRLGHKRSNKRIKGLPSDAYVYLDEAFRILDERAK